MMENTFDQHKYKGIINVFHIILKVIMIILYIALGFMAIGFLGVSFVPRSLLEIDLANFGQYQIMFREVLLELDPNFFTGTVNIKRPLLSILFTGIVTVGFLQFVIINLKNLVGHVKDTQIFDKTNARILKIMGFGFLIASILLPVMRSVSTIAVVNMFDIFQQIEFRPDFRWLSWSHIFMGSLILILAYVFSYGAYLQEEHDLTV